MNSFFLSVGSNIRPGQNIPRCLELLRREFTVKKISSVYETEPVGPWGLGTFWNLAVSIESKANSQKVREKLRALEKLWAAGACRAINMLRVPLTWTWSRSRDTKNSLSPSSRLRKSLRNSSIRKPGKHGRRWQNRFKKHTAAARLKE